MVTDEALSRDFVGLQLTDVRLLDSRAHAILVAVLNLESMHFAHTKLPALHALMHIRIHATMAHKPQLITVTPAHTPAYYLKFMSNQKSCQLILPVKSDNATEIVIRSSSVTVE